MIISKKIHVRLSVKTLFSSYTEDNFYLKAIFYCIVMSTFLKKILSFYLIKQSFSSDFLGTVCNKTLYPYNNIYV